MLAALAFVPIGDVQCYFAELKEETPEVLRDFVEYFDRTYVNGEISDLSTFSFLFYQ